MDTAFSHGHPDHDACGTGFVVRPAGGATHEVVDRALIALQRLSHRGGVDADASSGDGAGLLTALPQRMLTRVARDLRVPLPRAHGVGMLFIQGDNEEARVHAELSALAADMGLHCLGWRKVPTNRNILGARAAETAPAIWQCFWGTTGQSAGLERQLFLFRKRAEAELGEVAYFCSLSSRTIVYKGLLAPRQLAEFYPDLTDPDFETSFAIFHQRFSTNTQPAWRLAQPFRMLAHNGEINTITGNRRWMIAREAEIRARLKAGEWLSVLENNVSDSANLDNALELLVQQGLPVDHAMLNLVPPVADKARLGQRIAGLVENAAREYEPWDGPAALVFSDGRTLGAKLDRNGLRPMRYTQTSTGWLMAGSETGLADFDEREIIERQRLGPGEALLIDIASGRVYPRTTFVRETNTKQVAIPKQITRLAAGTDGPSKTIREPKKIAAALGWSDDQIKFFLHPLAEGKEPVYSMGDDTPPAFLSKMRRTLWDYCKQRFAQVTNPPIDPIRELHVMSLDTRIGPDFIADSPVLDEHQVRTLQQACPNAQHIDITFDSAQGPTGALEAIERIRNEVRWAAGIAPTLVVISDRGVNEQRAAVPVLLAVAAAWKEMIRGGHFRIPLIAETAQVIETHHVALLLAVGATAVRPFLAQQIAEEQVAGGARNYCTAINGGLRKVLSRMGISTLASYRNAQLFEVIGLEEKVCCDFFESVPRCAEANSLDQLLGDYLFNHAQAFKPEFKAPADSGLYRFRKEGEKHATSADLMRKLQAHIKNPDTGHYQEFEALATEREPIAIHDLLDFVSTDPLPVDSVEPQAAILQRFAVQAMSVGAISPEAHRTLALAMNELGARSNTGEGGEDPEIYTKMPEASCRVKQVSTARFGVTAEYLVNAEELEIKIAQGSKPGEGGQIPATKVTAYIAKLRHAVPGMALVSPPPHHDIYSIEDLEQLIHDLRQINPAARIGVKLVSGAGVGIIAAGVAKAGANVITISGYDGGTGASPLSSIKNTGLPWEFGLRDAHRTLINAGLRQNVRLRVDGGFKFARDVVMAALLGADEFGFGTAALLAMGCVMARQCHLNTCPVGIATQDETLRTRFNGKPKMVKDYFKSVAAETRVLLGRLGVHSLEEIIGRTELLQPRTEAAGKWISGLLQPTPIAPYMAPRSKKKRELSQRLIEISKGFGRTPSPILPIVNADRSIGAELTSERLRQQRLTHAPHTPMEIHFRGTAGQSFGAFLGANIKFHLNGAANDYVGKGLSGGTITIEAGSESSRRGDVLAGNTVLYGATSGELYVAGQAGERFAVRNSGAISVVEGVGDHACEYMTGGVVVILGPVGINLGSGMTGGLTYLLGDYVSANSYNKEFVQIMPCTAEEEQAVRQLVIRHWMLTRSERAASLLASGLRLPITRMQPLTLPCSVTDTWKPILQRFERAAISNLYSSILPLKNTVRNFPRHEVRIAPQSVKVATARGPSDGIA